jgi:hypothetical protein
MVQKIKSYLTLLGWLIPGLGYTQRIDHTASFRQMTQPTFIRLHYDNDFFRATDFYYSQGYSIEAVHPALRKNPLTRLLIKARATQARYGLAFEHYGFTPTNIQSKAILMGDRPFAAGLLLKTFSQSFDTLRRVRVSSMLSTGMMGPVALGGQIQSTLHRLLNGVEPRGWQHQIRNDMILNYSLRYEQQFYAYRQALSMSVLADAQVGTFLNGLQTGVIVMAGRFNSPFGPPVRKGLGPMQVYGYIQPLVRLVAYDATLQGGLLNRSSPYVLGAHQLRRTTMQANVGAVFSYKHLYLEYYQSVLSREFVTGQSHQWGGVKMGLSLDTFTHSIK